MVLNVLIVDDSDVVRAMIVRTLRLADIELGEVHEASNGREALSMLDRVWIDLVLADINMPVMDGGEMIEKMRAVPEHAGVPVIVVTTEGESERIEALLRKGVTAWIRKPFTPEEIREVVSAFIETHSVEHHDEVVAQVFTQVAERFAFVTPDPMPVGRIDAPEAPILLAQLSLSGQASGTLALAADSDLCGKLAANVLGEDEDSAGSGGDVLGELLNLVGGHIATELQTEQPIQLTPPVVMRMTGDQWAVMASDPGCGAYVIEDSPVLLGLWLRTQAENPC